MLECFFCKPHSLCAVEVSVMLDMLLLLLYNETW